MRTSLSIAAVSAVLWASSAWALPVAPQAFCDTYPDAPRCIAGVPACTFCHMGAPPDRNLFGKMVEAQLLPGAPRPLQASAFLEALPAALASVESLDADGDGYSNVDEILAGTLPADDLSAPVEITCESGARTNPDWDVCRYDPRYAFKKVRVDFCGQSPTYDELTAFDAESDKTAALGAALDQCLDSEFWLGKNGQLWRLANRKVTPIQAIKSGSEEGGPIPLADYYDDYNLFVWTQTDDHDARDVLLADYFVTRRTTANQTTYALGNAEQSVVQARRTGLLTTKWYLVRNVMFSALPRTAAAQAYRSYLGLDIAKSEGLNGIPGEPVDYDEKGVTAEYCARCHSTLDPLSYPFKNYQGITGDFGSYDPNRIENDFAGEAANITDMPEMGYIFGEPVADLNEWAQVAANSKLFADATVRDYWKLLVGIEADSSPEFVTLWQNFMDPNQDNYRVERMLHALIRTEAYGVP